MIPNFQKPISFEVQSRLTQQITQDNDLSINILRFKHNNNLIALLRSRIMGNTCEFDSECVQSNARDSIRRRSFTDPNQNVSLKNLIQIKKGRITDEYVLNELLGEGSYGNVYKVTHKESKVVRAAKRIQKKKKSIQVLEQSLILKRLDHPNIIRIYDIYYDKKYLYIVMDYCEGGQLFDRIVKQQNLTESEAVLYMKQMLSAIHHCHTHNIMHRDLKPENIMFLSKKEKNLKIIDFGVGTSFKDNKKTSLKVGSIYYMAPEVIKKKYNQKCDIWSLGIIMYIMLTGMPPFMAKTDNEIYDLILKGDIQYPESKWSNISKSAKDLVQKMLTFNPAARVTAKEALSHPWIKLGHQLGNKTLYVGNQFESIKNFCEMNQFQSAIMVFISHNFMQNELIRELQSKFKNMDRNDDGQISWQEFKDCYIENMPPIQESELREIFSKLDKNRSGFIDYSQFISSTMDKNYLVNENLASKAFDMIDKDKNGYLIKEELMESFGGCNYEVYSQILQDFDVNHDGKISKYQFKLAMKGLLKK